jgi:exosortase
MSKTWDWRRLRPWCLAGLVVVAIVLFIRPLAIVIGSSIQVDQYSQVLVVPPLALCLLYFDRRKLFQEVRYQWLGAASYVVIAVAYLVGSAFVARTDFSTWLAFSLVLFAATCASAFWFCYGTGALRAGEFPLFFLVLMAPLPDSLRESVITFLQQGSAVVTDWLFTASRIPFTRDGVVLSLPTVTIEIAKECSGIRSSMVLFFGGLVLAHLFLRSRWSKFALIILMIPLTIVKNGIRIFTLSTLGMYVDESFLTGRLHHNGGVVFFALAFAALWGMVWALQRGEDRLLGPVNSRPAVAVRSV